MFDALKFCFEETPEIGVNIAFLLSKLRHLETEQIKVGSEWLQMQMEHNAGSEVLIEVGSLVLKIVNNR